MKLRVLGCSGGIGGPQLRTTSFLVDHDILIDAGSGVGELALPQLERIDHVFVTHAHLDHVLALPLMLDAIAGRREKPVLVYAIPEVIASLRQHIFNGSIWPDFSRLPDEVNPFLRFVPINFGETVSLDDREITALPVAHTVPAAGFRLDSGRASLVFSGDTGPCDAFWQAVRAVENLRYLIVECAYSNQGCEMATLTKHMCPRHLAAELRHLDTCHELFITHLKPGEVEQTMAELDASLGDFSPRRLQNDQLFEF